MNYTVRGFLFGIFVAGAAALIAWQLFHPRAIITAISIVMAIGAFTNAGRREEKVRRGMGISKEETIWFPETYEGRQGVYAKTVAEAELDIVELVQKRAKEDGEWTIENGFVGDNEDKMRQMMVWVSDATNIAQCVDHIYKEGMENERTVDWVCRDLANASKWVHGSRG